jgi:hypothetical protein
MTHGFSCPAEKLAPVRAVIKRFSHGLDSPRSREASGESVFVLVHVVVFCRDITYSCDANCQSSLWQYCEERVRRQSLSERPAA